MKAEDFDKKFDEDKSEIINNLDLKTIRRPNQEQKRVSVDLPTWVIELLKK